MIKALKKDLAATESDTGCSLEPRRPLERLSQILTDQR